MNTSYTLKLHSSHTLDIYSIDTDTILKLPLISQGISAGFPSPALDFDEVAIDMNEYLVENKDSTFYGRAKGQSMKDDGIDDGDLLVIDKSIRKVNGRIAVCFIEGEFTLKRIKIENGECWLLPANEKYDPIQVSEGDELTVWGIVTFIIKSAK